MPSLPRIVDHLAATRARLMRSADQVSPENWRREPPRGGWSAAEVIAHLTQVERGVATNLGKQVERGPRPRALPMRVGLPLRMAAYRVVRRQTPLSLDRALLDEKETMLAELRTAREQTLRLAKLFEERNLTSYRWPHPVFGMLNAYEWLRFLGYHEMRHGKQIQEIVDSVQK